MTISLIIPTTPNHFKYLKCVLSHYLNGTVLPDEVIISISNSHQIDRVLIDSLKNDYENKFKRFILVENNYRVEEGPNRGKGSEYSKCDILTYHDSDDIPHPQRIEIIKHFFDNYDILHLNHSYSFDTKFTSINIDTIQTKTSDELYSKYFKNLSSEIRPRKVYDDNGNSLPYGSGFGWAICGGPTSIKKEVLNKVKWNQTMDVSYDYDFSMDSLFYLNKSIIINVPLIWYNKIGNIDWACN
jgi:Glycosyl transferase family 2